MEKEQEKRTKVVNFQSSEQSNTDPLDLWENILTNVVHKTFSGLKHLRTGFSEIMEVIEYIEKSEKRE